MLAAKNIGALYQKSVGISTFIFKIKRNHEIYVEVAPRQEIIPYTIFMLFWMDKTFTQSLYISYLLGIDRISRVLEDADLFRSLIWFDQQQITYLTPNVIFCKCHSSSQDSVINAFPPLNCSLSADIWLSRLSPTVKAIMGGNIAIIIIHWIIAIDLYEYNSKLIVYLSR